MLRLDLQSYLLSDVYMIRLKQISCVYCNMPGKIRVGRSGIYFYFIFSQLICTFLVAATLHQHTFVFIKETES